MTSQTEQVALIPEAENDRPYMIAKVNAMAVKLVSPFIANNDIRYYLNGINIRPLEDGSVMLVATDGHRYVVVRDPNGYTEKELIVSISKDAVKHTGSTKNSLDVLSNGLAQISGDTAQPVFIQPGNSLMEGIFPRIERVASLVGYKEGINGAVNPRYLQDALAVSAKLAGSIRFFTKDENSALTFVMDGIGDLECFGGIMKKRDTCDALPAWFPEPGEAMSVEEM